MVNILGLIISLNLRRKDNKIPDTKRMPGKIKPLIVKVIPTCNNRISA